MNDDTYLTESALLIVDDTPLNLQILFNYLKKIKCQVRVATSGRQALALAKTVKLDLILLDVMMPELNGFETCRLLKKEENSKDVPVIFMTALSETQQKLKAFKMGAVDYITKPIQHEEVMARIRTHLQLRYQQQQLSLQNDALIENNLFLQQQNKEFDAIAQTITQNLRLPLVVLSGFTKMLQAEINNLPNPEQPTQYLQEIEQTRLHMVSNIDNLLLLTDVRRKNSEMEELNMVLLIKLAQQTVSYLLQKYMANFKMSNNTYPSVLGNPDWIEKVWTTYMEYALTHGGRPAEIIISTEILVEAQMVKFKLQYNGQILTQAQRDDLFIPFTEGLGSKRIENRDLSLSAVRRIIEKCQGDVGVEDIPNSDKKGNILYFTLPMAMG